MNLDCSWNSVGKSSGDKNIVQNLLLRGGLWLTYHCSWVVAI